MNRKNRKRVLAVVLSILMIVSAIDYRGLQYISAETMGGTKTITAFAMLEGTIADQKIAVGAEESAITLPSTLTVTAQPSVATGSAINLVLEGITWKIDEKQSASVTLDSSMNGAIYIYVPNLPATDNEGDSLVLEAGVQLPQICVQIGEVGTDVAVVTIGSVATSYKDIKTALNDAVQANSSQLTLLADISVGETLNLPSGKTMVINLNGHTWSDTNKAANALTINNKGELTVMDTVGSGAIRVTGRTDGKMFTNWNTLTITSGSYEVQGGELMRTYKTTNISGGNFSNSAGGNVFVLRINNDPAKFTMSGGSITKGALCICDENTSSYLAKGGEIELTGGSYSRIKFGNKYGDPGRNVGNILMLGIYYCDNTSGARITDSSTLSQRSIDNVSVNMGALYITKQPTCDSVLEFGRYSGIHLSVDVTKGSGASGEVSYQWYQSIGGQSATTIEGADKASYTLPENLTKNTYAYYCEVSLGGDSLCTNQVTFEVKDLPQIVLVTSVKGVDTTYSSLQKAVDAARDGDTVKLLTNNSCCYINNKMITLDINGYSLSAETPLYLTNTNLTLINTQDTGYVSGYDSSQNSISADDNSTVRIGAVRIIGCICAKHVVLSGGSFDQLDLPFTTLREALAEGYAYRSTTDSTWVTDASVLSGNSIANVSVVMEPVRITDQPKNQAAYYGYTSAPQLTVTATNTDTGIGKEITYQWHRIGSGAADADEAITSAINATYEPTGLAIGAYSYYCKVTCDGYSISSKPATVTITKENGSGSVSMEGWTYGEPAKDPVSTSTTNGTDHVTYEYKTKGAEDSSYSNTKPTVAGEYTVKATFAATEYYSEAIATADFTIAKANQSTFSITKVLGKKYLDSAFTLTSIGGSGEGEIIYSVSEGNGVLSISNDQATIIGAGTVTVTATKAADANHNSATATCDIIIAKAPAPSIDFPKASDITYGQKLSAIVLKGGSTHYGTFAWVNSDIVPNVGNSGYKMTFTPNENTKANYEAITGTTDTIAITVSKVTPAVTVNATVSDDAGSRKVVLTASVTGVGDGDAPVGTVKFINSTSGSDADIKGATAVAIKEGKATYTWTGLANQIYKVKAVYSGSANYDTTTSTELEIDTNKQNQAALAIENIGTKIYGDEAFALLATGGSGTGAVSYTSSDETIVSISGNTAFIHKAGNVTLTATKAGDSTYQEATAAVTLTVGRKALSVKAVSKLNMIKGASMPELTYTVTGLVGSDTFTSPTITTTAADSGTVGEYDILISGGILTNADNYTVNYIGGKLTIINKPTEPGGSSTGGGTSTTTTTDTSKPNVGTPEIKDTSNKAGWEAIKEQISQTQEGNAVTIEMNGSLVVPREILGSIRGTDITLAFDMGDGITWSVNGKSITDSSLQDINFGVTMDTDVVPENLVKQVAKEQAYRSISLSHNGEFGFTAVLSVNMGKKNAGLYANLFYYNPSTKKLELQSIGKINDSGYAEYVFTHASDYVVAISTEPMFAKALDQTAISTEKGYLYVGGTRNRSMKLKVELPNLLKELKEKDSSQLVISYQSSNPKVATVTDTGKIVARKSGETTITTRVTIAGVQKSFKTTIKVRNAYIKLLKSTSSMEKGKTFTFQAKGYGVNTKDIKYYTSKKSIIGINTTTGKAVAKSSGTGYVIAKAGNVEVKIKVEVR
ncbi:MAG TPA: MBG domain-containing protein [Lachnospiraceae bacterium]|nr:MBG domain-containing protein [Lachnospiraceae bacterium]